MLISAQLRNCTRIPRSESGRPAAPASPLAAHTPHSPQGNETLRDDLQLTGVRQGLAPFYERAAFLRETDREAFSALLQAGDPAARKAERRFWRRMRETLRPVIERFETLRAVDLAAITDLSLTPASERFESWWREDQTDLGRLTGLLAARARRLEANEDRG